MPGNPWKSILEARRKLTEYIEALWDARSSAPDGWKLHYTERLAAAAKISTLLEWSLSFSVARDLLRRESEFFPRHFLETDGGRDARAKFNQLSRAISALEDYAEADGSFDTGPQSLVGEQVSSVEFVTDYVQIHFHGQNFQAFCPVILQDLGGTHRTGEAGFRDHLCSIIGQAVRSVSVGDTSVVLELSSARAVFEFADPTWPEPLVFTNLDKTIYYYK